MGIRLIIVWMLLPCLPLLSQTDTASNELQQIIESAKENYNQGQYIESVNLLQRALQAVAEKKDKSELPGIYHGLGRNYCELGDLSKGLEYYYKALHISETLGDKNGMASSHQYIGAIFEDHDDDSLALKNYLVALELNSETGNRFGWAQNNNSVGEIYRRQGRYSESLKMFEESLKIYQEKDAPAWGIPYTLECIGSGYDYKGDSAQRSGNRIAAESYYKEALNIYFLALDKFKTLGVMGGIAEQYLYIGALMLKLRWLEQAKEYLETGLKYFMELKNKEMLSYTFLHLSTIDSLAGNYETALRHYKLSTAYRDSVFNTEEYRKVALYKTQYELEKKEEEIKLLAAENELRKQQKLSAYALMLLVVLVSGYGVYRYRRSKKTEMERARLNDRLHISQGLHDDIGSTLSSISVYTHVAQKLSESNKKEDLDELLGKIKSTSTEMISEMNDIVWTIHPRNDTMEKIILRMESFARPMLATRNIGFKLEYDPAVCTTQLEMEKRKNFYLVFKEAVNNAFKYSGCTEIMVRIANSHKQLDMLIGDNGVGFEVEQELSGNKLTLSGNGLRNMKLRAEEMKGELQINSVVGEGTRVRLRIPIP